MAGSEITEIRRALSEMGSHLEDLCGRVRRHDLQFRRIILATVRRISYSGIRESKETS